MIYESIENTSVPKIGLGTARLGGRIMPNRRRDHYWFEVLRAALERGYTHLDTAESYALGYTEELIGRALRELPLDREAIFITTKV
jgi:aryl-alcohol dehydrogenase-like predicted oxidoreductase